MDYVISETKFSVRIEPLYNLFIVKTLSMLFLSAYFLAEIQVFTSRGFTDQVSPDDV